MKHTSSILFAILLLATAFFGQSSESVAPIQTFHVRGTVSGPLGDDVVPGTEISFQKEHESTTVFSDSKGSYEVDLPVGLYTMTAQYKYLVGARNPHVQKYVRPLFRVSSPTNVVLNISMFAERFTCDIVVGGKAGQPATREQLEWSQKNLCGGEDLFSIPSTDGAPFQVYIRYPKRSPTDQVDDYRGAQLATNAYTPVLVEYNLFTLTAECVAYDKKNQTIAASGNVVASNEFGETQYGASMSFKIRDGQAFPIR
jgi:hypothetical protein